MVMVPMFDVEELDQLVWPRPELRVISGGRDGDAAPIEKVRRPVNRRPSARVLRRRRQVVGVLAAGIVALTFWALSAILPSPLPVGAASTMAPGVSLNGYYTVQVGDTVSSIATAVADGRSVAAVQSAILADLGTSVIVPGERIPIP
jgi:hypothetical protein